MLSLHFVETVVFVDSDAVWHNTSIALPSAFTRAGLHAGLSACVCSVLSVAGHFHFFVPRVVRRSG